jgi:PAS domain S-box-containing protein
MSAGPQSHRHPRRQAAGLDVLMFALLFAGLAVLCAWQSSAVGLSRFRWIALLAMTGAGLLLTYRFARLRRGLGHQPPPDETAQSLLSAIVNETSDAIFAKDLRGRYLFMNHAALRMVGKTLDEVLGTDDHAVFTPTEANKMVESDQLVMRKGEISSLEEQVTFADKSVHTVLTTKGALRDSEEQVIGLFGIARDVTEHRQAEAQLREQERRLRSIFLAAPTGIGVIVGRIFKDANDRLCEMTGYSRGELLDHDSRMLYLNQEDYAEVGRVIADVTSELRTGVIESRWRRKDGSVIDVLLSATLLDRRDLSHGLTFTAMDLTARKKAEQALRQSEQRLHSLFSNMAEGVALHELVLDDAGRPVNYRIVDINPQYERILDLKRAQVVGKLGTEVYGTELPPYLEEFSQVAISGMATRLETYFPPMARHFDISIAPWGQKGFATIFSDITERKRVQQEREELLAREQTARVQAEAANRAKDELLGIVSHELRTPLTPILAAADLLRRDCNLDSENRQWVETIRDCALLEARLVGDLLDMTSLTTGKLTLRLERVDAHRIIHAVVELYRPAISERILNVQIECEAAEPFVRADPARLQQVLWNLVGNAVKFTPAGGNIIVRTRNDVRPLPADPRDAKASNPPSNRQIIRVEITDSGIGFDAEFQARMFRAFEQRDRSLTREFGGLGLGLSLARGLVDLQGGCLYGSSPGKGHGATFIVELPVEAGEPATNSAPAEAANVR